jgi:hypothetical protein
MIPIRSEAALIDNMVGYWDFESNLANKGSAGSALNATVITGTPTAGAVGGRAGRGLALVKSETDAIRLPIGTATLGGNFTVSAWFIHNGATNANAADNRSFVFESQDTGVFDVSFGTTTTNNSYVSYNAGAATHTATLPNDVWHHVVHTFTVSGSNVVQEVYLNGVRQTITNASQPLANMSFTGLNVGKARDGTSPGRYFNGTIDEFAIWTRPLSEAEALQVYNLGVAGAAIPEPTTAAAISLAGGLLAFRRRRR